MNAEELENTIDRRDNIMKLCVIILSAVLLAMIIAGLIWNIRTGNADKAHARLACIEAGGTWVADECIAPRAVAR